MKYTREKKQYKDPKNLPFILKILYTINFITGTSPLISFRCKIWSKIQIIFVLIYFSISCRVIYTQIHATSINFVTRQYFQYILFLLSMVSMSMGTVVCWIVRWQFSELFFKIVSATLKVRCILLNEQDNNTFSMYFKMFVYILIVNLAIAFALFITIPITYSVWVILFLITIWFWDWVVIGFVLNFFFIDHYFILLNKTLKSIFHDMKFRKGSSKFERRDEIENRMKVFCILHENVQNFKTLIEYPVLKT